MRLLFGTCCCLLVALLLLQAWSASAEKQPVEMLRTYCTVCHDLERVRRNVGRQDKNGWLSYIGRMQQKGAKISDGEKNVLALHLSSIKRPDF